MDLLRHHPVQGDDLAEFEGARSIDRLITLPHHVHEGLGRAEHALDVGRGVTEGGGAIVEAEGFDLALDHVADGGLVRLGHLRLCRQRESQHHAEKGEEAKDHARHVTLRAPDARPP